jgi:hypothetical protein
MQVSRVKGYTAVYAPTELEPTCSASSIDAEQLAGIDALDNGIRGGPEPEDIMMEKFGRPIPAA